jgi:hypothetical protein
MSLLVLPLAALGAYVKKREPYTDIRVDESVSGKEARSSWWMQPRYRYTVGLDVLRGDAGSRQDWQQFIGHFARHFGSLDSFLMQDPDDYTVSDHGFGVGDGTTSTFQLQRTMLGSVYDTLGGPWATSSKPRTNLALYSQAFDSWATATAGGLAAPTVTPASLMAPDGTMTAGLLSFPSSSATGQASAVRQAVGIPAAGSGAYTASVWVNGLAGTTVYVWLETGSGAGYAGTSAVLTGSWQRLTFAATLSGGGSYYLSLGVSTQGASTQPAIRASSSFWAWGAQLELAPAVTQYIPTDSARVVSSPTYWPAFGAGFEPVFDPAPWLGIQVDGVSKTVTTDYLVGETGVIGFVTPPAAGSVLSWAGSYYRRVRFADPGLPLTRMGAGFWSGDVNLVSVLP